MLLSIRNLGGRFWSPRGIVRAVSDVNLDVQPGEIVGIAGESGSGKSVTCMAVMGLLPTRFTHVTGSVTLEGRPLLDLPEQERRRLRGRTLAMIFQDPSSCLDPIRRIGSQIMEALKLAEPDLPRAELRDRARDLLRRVGIADSARRMDEYPHQLSGGMNQRVMIAMTLACSPRLLFADEPTTALDVTTQAQILDLIRSVAAEHNMAVVLVTHDLGVMAQTADRVAVMYAGRVVENAPVGELFNHPSHPYTRALLKACPRTDITVRRLPSIPGTVPPLTEKITGCAFAPRCAEAMPVCPQIRPRMLNLSRDDASFAAAPGTEHFCACHRNEIGSRMPS